MINNRQNGRRRGRGGGGPRSPNQPGNISNRQDNRSRGNAAQLLEKYKSLARDAQMQGDRVQSEYWLQFADHYYRVLNENRARFEDQRPRRDDFASDEDEDQDEGVHAEGDDGDDREDRDDRDVRDVREPRDDARNRYEGRERPRREYREERNGEGRNFRPRRDRDDQPRGDARQAQPEADGGERISLDVLPPAIAVIEGDAPAKAPRRRTRRPREDDAGDAEIAPAA